MKDKISVKPDTIYLEDLLQDISDGIYKIPVFQRDFVWKPNQILDLFDSILKGYPIGSLLFWKPNEEFDTKNEVGPYFVDKTAKEISYVLDGFQRISTLFGVLTNPKNYELDPESKAIKDFTIYFDVRKNTFLKVKYQRDKSVYSAPLYTIYDNRELFNLIRELDKENLNDSEKNVCIDNARNLHDILHKYRLPFVQIAGGDIKSAVDIFSRINSEGTKISEDFLLSALSYNNQSGFLLADTITGILDSFTKYNFNDLKRDTIFNCIANSKGKLYYDVKIEELKDEDKYNIESLTNDAIIHIEKSVEFLYKKIGVLNYSYLPYPTQLIFISEFFRLNPNPSEQKTKKLEKWFWITTYSNYFSNYSLSQQRSAYKAFCDFAENTNDDGVFFVNEDEKFSTYKFPQKIDFTGVRSKALQLFLISNISKDLIIEENESVIEQFIFGLNKNRTRTPANIILRLSSEFETNRDVKHVETFIRNSDVNQLAKYFINKELQDLYINILDSDILRIDPLKLSDQIELFISKREELIRESEQSFVESLNITYNNDDGLN